MATKSALTTAINGYITAVINIANHRLSMLELINSLFQTTVIDSDITGINKFTKDLRYKKIGNIVYIDGWIRNNYTTSQADLNIAVIPNSLFYAKTGQNTDVIQFSTSNPYKLTFITDSIYLTHSIPPFEKIFINAHYQTND